ncbi:putative C-_U-editing enzyme APOBEC-4 [Pristis pectinata]|uniref:putative C->U-editing enzyme APOBEC-4 n=1 Tax=Pristis pectinata TaxID=685728 RepID=UPI00223D3C1C|nr:putative C->U-editing enzyme APOBEC-4 [Pristis pectinata]
MVSTYEEYTTTQGTLVKPYYWLHFTEQCSKCPYHIKTGEEARVSYMEFYKTFGFPYAQPQSGSHLCFYELKLSSGTLVQKGQVSNCTLYQLHPESMFFDIDGYLDALMYSYENIAYVTIYSNYTPCNERAQYCISKMYDFLINYPSTRLDIYFSALYHTDDSNIESGWNREALHCLAALWPRVTINPISNGTWLTILHRFVYGMPWTALHNPILPERALADLTNAHQIVTITGVNPYYIDVTPPVKHPKQHFKPEDMSLYKSTQAPLPIINKMALMAPYQPYTNLPNLPALHRSMYPLQSQKTKPKNVVRHLNLPNTSEWKTLSTPSPHNVQVTEIVEMLEAPATKKASDSKKQRKSSKRTKSTRR